MTIFRFSNKIDTKLNQLNMEIIIILNLESSLDLKMRIKASLITRMRIWTKLKTVFSVKLQTDFLIDLPFLWVKRTHFNSTLVLMKTLMLLIITYMIDMVHLNHFKIKTEQVSR